MDDMTDVTGKKSTMLIRWAICCLFLLTAIAVPAQSQDDEVDDYILEIEMHFGVVDDPDVVARVGEIERRLLAVIPEAETDEREVIIKVLDEDNVNAFALPDGHVYLFMGLLDECETDDMLAGVMAHELVHVFHKHHSRMGERQLRGMLIGLIAIAATGDLEAIMLGQMLSAGMVETYGRAAENDADSTGARWSVEAGYDPVGFLELMQILEQEAIHRPEPGGNYFTVHPHPDERMANIRATLDEMGVEVPANIYRVHLQLQLYLPLNEIELERMSEWESNLERRAEGPSEDAGGPSENNPADEIARVEIPQFLLDEYHFRQMLFEGITAPEDGSQYGVVTVGNSDDSGVFYIASDSMGELVLRSENIISRLGDKFLDGLRSYDVQTRTIDGVPALLADRRIVAYVTEEDAELLGITPEETNQLRKGTLKDILYRYYVDRRI